MSGPYGTGAPERVEHAGKMRQVVGRLTYPEPPEPGTIVGYGRGIETLVVLGTVDGVSLMGRAIVSDMDAAAERVSDAGPASMAEWYRMSNPR